MSDEALRVERSGNAERRAMSAGITTLPLCGYHEKGLWWFRIYGYGVHWKNTKLHPLLFSERNGLVKGLHIGRWCFKWLRTEPGR